QNVRPTTALIVSEDNPALRISGVSSRDRSRFGTLSNRTPRPKAIDPSTSSQKMSWISTGSSMRRKVRKSPIVSPSSPFPQPTPAELQKDRVHEVAPDRSPPRPRQPGPPPRRRAGAGAEKGRPRLPGRQHPA